MGTMKYVIATIVPKTRNGEGPAYGAPRARRSKAWLPQAAISPSESSPEPTKSASNREPPRMPAIAIARPSREASQPMTNSAGEARPSIVNVVAPGRAGGGSVGPWSGSGEPAIRSPRPRGRDVMRGD